MGTVIKYPRRVARAKYSPPTDEVARQIDAMVEAFRAQQAMEAEYRQRLAECASAEGPAVPIAYLAERLGVERKTVYRHLGRSMT